MLTHPFDLGSPITRSTIFYIFANVRAAATTLLPKQGFGMNSMEQSIIAPIARIGRRPETLFMRQNV
jgi:hypothetical protein